MVKRVIIAGAGGRDFHNFLTYFRDNPEYEVVAFTAAQIPGIERRRFPPELAGPRYPLGIPIYPESELPRLIKEFRVDEVVLSYSDLTYEDVGRLASIVLASGASFRLLSPFDTMLRSIKPVIAVTAVRTGAGKSTVSRAIVRELVKRGVRVVPIRHPMAYGDLVKSAVQIFRSEDDFERFGVTIEEREEYEQYIRLGLPVLAGVDYRRILVEAERMGDVILWDGGNNDCPFLKFDYMITVADAMRPGQEVGAYPGEVNVRLANAVVVNKVSRARKEDVEKVVANVRKVNPKAKILLADMEVTVEKPELIKGKRVAVVEDSPSVTHGGLPYGAGYVAAEKYGAAQIVDPRPYAVGIIKAMLEEYKHMGPVVPSTGYSPEQIADLNETLRRMDVDAIVLGTPADISKLLKVGVPVLKVYWELRVVEGPSIEELVDELLERVGVL
ncbi:MAG: cyclic 2,3-diphosphoglycerate synthase [Desulfurococcaceae archaeon]|nr:cyclic 2,3-diphosphoglycerate synthase [Desulfurococcaceae archaeon]